MKPEERKELRKEFLDYYLFSSIPSMRWGLLVNLLLFVAFASVNELVFPEHEELRYFMRFGIIFPFFSISILVLYIRKLRPYLSSIFIIINILLCLAIFLIGISSHSGENGYEYYFVWVILMTVGLYTFYRLRFATLISLGALQLLAYILANLLNHSFRDEFFMSLNNLFFIIAAAILGFFIAFTFQNLNKKNYLHQKALDAQYKRLLTEFKEKAAMEAELKQAVEQKGVMLKEIHHRVKNNLAIVISMLSLQMRQLPDPDLKRVIGDIEMRIRSMALIHEHLYRSEDLDRIRLHEYLKALTTIVLSTWSTSRIDLDTEFEPMDVSIEAALPIGLITNELMTNSIKYAFPDNRQGTIKVWLRKADKYIHLTISDNGIGLPEGFHMEDQKTLGMFIIKLLVEQLAGQLHIENKKGVSFTIHFPVTPILKPFNQ
ncbi:MAG: sensor histidine kinase [Bacteroidetes bacterium]|nr:MAG: sensor histidine kinase [Bacteroidota bacterium]